MDAAPGGLTDREAPTMPPLVSVVIPTYRARRYVGLALDSCLRQTYPDLEVIVVDDHSPEGDAEVAEEVARRDPRVRVLRHPANGGVSRAFNTGFRAARGEYLTRLAADDLFREDAVRIMADHLGAHPDVGVAYCDMELIDEAGTVIQPMRTEEPERALLPTHRLGLCVMWRREVWERVGEFRPHLDSAEDYDFFLRASRHFRLGKCGAVAPFYYRYHPDQISGRQESRQRLAIARAQLSHAWAEARRRPADLGAWKRTVSMLARLPYRWLQFRRHGDRPWTAPAETR
ncbi:MAG: hypothetical protein C0501_27165 [Isosphaera sp.]|nr:hypothetical protein [Isosphaera sp.]